MIHIYLRDRSSPNNIMKFSTVIDYSKKMGDISIPERIFHMEISTTDIRWFMAGLCICCIIRPKFRRIMYSMMIEWVQILLGAYSIYFIIGTYDFFRLRRKKPSKTSLM